MNAFLEGKNNSLCAVFCTSEAVKDHLHLENFTFTLYHYQFTVQWLKAQRHGTCVRYGV